MPDNMVVLSDQPVRAETSFNTPLEPAPPFGILEYVSKYNKRKDYEDSFRKYERDLKVPYYLVFYPDAQELTLYRHTGRKYVAVLPDEQDRHALSQLELEVGLQDGWVRFWYQGQLLQLPADLQHKLDEARKEAAREKRRATRARHRAEEAVRQAEQEKHRAEQEAVRRRAAEQEVAELRARLAQLQSHPNPPA